MSDAGLVEAANSEFYAAIEAGDVARIEQVWDDADDVVCIHPGWPAVRGRAHILRSYSAIMANTAYLQFFTTGVDVDLAGEIAVVTCEHSLITRVNDTAGDSAADLGETARIVATNIFRRRPSGWRLWTHHGSPIMAKPDEAQ